MTDLHKGPGSGGSRNGAGRPRGSRNKTTIARESALKDAWTESYKNMTAEQISNLQPLDVMLIAMRLEFAAGDTKQAAIIAERAAIYCHAKRSAEATLMPLPEDLLPDPPSQGDEPGPPGGVIQ
jgi:hypothetical protein